MGLGIWKNIYICCRKHFAIHYIFKCPIFLFKTPVIGLTLNINLRYIAFGNVITKILKNEYACLFKKDINCSTDNLLIIVLKNKQ